MGKDLVKPNYEALKEDLKRYGITGRELNTSLGKNNAYLTNTFGRELAERSVIEAIEDRMFREHGSYYTEIEKPAQKFVEPVKTVSEGVGIVLKQILSVAGAVSSSVPKVGEEVTKVIYRIDGFKAGNDRKIDELIKAVKESNAANEVILQDILQKQKEMTTLAARILSAMERRQG